MSWQEIYERTEAYLTGEMEAEEREAFEKACQEDETFAQEVKLYLKSVQEIRYEGQESLRTELKERFNNLDLAIPGRKREIFSWSYVAAAAIALIVLGLWLWQPSKKEAYTPEELYSMYMDEAFVSQFRSLEGDSLSEQWQKVLDLVEDSLQADAIPLIDSLMKDSSFVSRYGGRARLYQGHAYMYMENFEAALQSFELLSEENPYYDQILWYKALSLLRVGKGQEARDILQEIAGNEFHYKRKEAASILDKLSD